MKITPGNRLSVRHKCNEISDHCLIAHYRTINGEQAYHDNYAQENLEELIAILSEPEPAEETEAA